MSFRITPEDVGRPVKMRNGNEGVIVQYDDDDGQPVMARFGGASYYYTPLGRIEVGFNEPDEFDLIAWADEPATDQDTDQVRPKDLRDEFAMVAFSAHFSTDTIIKALRDLSEAEKMEPADLLSKVCYEYADAMMKARGK